MIILIGLHVLLLNELELVVRGEVLSRQLVGLQSNGIQTGTPQTVVSENIRLWELSGEGHLRLQPLLGVIESLLVLSLIHISEPTRLRRISYAVFCLKKKKKHKKQKEQH